MSIEPPSRSRQPIRPAWSHERLVHERSIALGNSLDSSTRLTYNSHLQSYLAFCKAHNMPVDPTPDTLSFYVVYMAHYINPKSLPSYLSGIVSSIEHLFPEARANRMASVVKRTLQGCQRLHPHETRRKRALMYSDLDHLLSLTTISASWDDILFATITLTGFYGLLRLGELVYPDAVASRNILKTIKRHSLELQANSYQFHLPAHKADRFFEGNVVLINSSTTTADPLPLFKLYLQMRDNAYPHHIPLFLRRDGSIPVRAWFISRIKAMFPDNVAGHSLRSGGATALALSGVDDNHIQAMGRWSSDAYQMYIRKHPTLLHTLVTGRAAFSRPAHLV